MAFEKGEIAKAERDKKDALIKEKEQEIERLKSEIKALKGPTGIAPLTKALLVTASGTSRGGIPHNGNSEDWKLILRVCLAAFRVSYVKDLSEEGMQVAAEMADEIIEIFNKYYKLANQVSVEK